MKHNMFCFQCEQTAGCTGCTGRAGVCRKQADTANLQDALTGALIALARTNTGQANSFGEKSANRYWMGCLQPSPMSISMT